MTSLLLLAAAGCGAAAVSEAQPAAPSAADPSSALPQLGARQRAALERLNEWCASYPDECDVAERPEAHPQRVPSGETGGWLRSQRAALSDVGLEVVWDPRARRFAPLLERDVRTVASGTFSVDHVGPEAHAAIVGRLRAQAGLALGLLVRHAEALDPAGLSNLHPSAVLALSRASEPALTRVAAARLAALYREAIDVAVSPPDDPHRVDRLRARLRGLTR